MTDNKENLWQVGTNPTEFFHEKITKAQENQGFKLTENVEFYLVNLLSDLVFSGLGANNTENCLVFLLKKALESERNGKVTFYKQLADTSLTFSGLFQDYFSNKSFDVGYYKSMGESAFDNLAALMSRKSSYEHTMSMIYAEMRDHFSTAVDVLMDVGEQTHLSHGNKSTLEIYDTWLSGNSQKLEKELLSRNIIPLKYSKKQVC